MCVCCIAAEVGSERSEGGEPAIPPRHSQLTKTIRLPTSFTVPLCQGQPVLPNPFPQNHCAETNPPPPPGGRGPPAPLLIPQKEPAEAPSNGTLSQRQGLSPGNKKHSTDARKGAIDILSGPNPKQKQACDFDAMSMEDNPRCSKTQP